MEFVFIALLLLAFPIIAIVALVMAVGARDRIRSLETKFDTFQKGLPGLAAAAADAQPVAAPQQTVEPVAPAAAPPRPVIVETPEPQVTEPPRAAEPPLAPEPVEPAAEPGAPPEPAPAPPPHAAAAASVPPITPPPPTPPSPPSQPEMGFEERLGTQWTVWVGGVALALGGFFLVRYSIEQGWFGPGMRIFLGGAVRARADRRGRMGAPQGEPQRHRPAFRPRTSRASSPPPAPPSPMPTSMRPTRSMNSSARAPPSCCSASSRSARWLPRWCTARRSPGSALSAPM